MPPIKGNMQHRYTTASMDAMAEWKIYYTMPRINFHTGKWEVQTLSTAQFFLEKQMISESLYYVEFDSESVLQTRLWALCSVDESYSRAHAALNFRCLISNTAKKTIDHLIAQVRGQLGLGMAWESELRQELYPCVLDDDGGLWTYQLSPQNNHQNDYDNDGKDVLLPLQFLRDGQDRLICMDGNGKQSIMPMTFSLQVLESFAPNRSNHASLKNWTVRLVRQHQEVKAVLREHGIYRCQPWRFLSRISPTQLRYIAEQNAELSSKVIDDQVRVLKLLHEVHRDRSFTQGQPGQRPTQRQQTRVKLERLWARLREENVYMPSVEALTDELKIMMNGVLKYQRRVSQPLSIDGGGGSGEPLERAPIIPCEAPTGLEALEWRLLGDLHEHICQGFYPLYEQQRLKLLDQAIDDAIQNRYDYLMRRHGGERATQYLLALQDFFGAQLSMQGIAERLGLKQQFKVSRLLQLSTKRHKQTHDSPDLLTTCTLCLAERLRTQFMDWIEGNATSEERYLLRDQPELLWTFLEAPIQDITSIFQDAFAEISCAKRSKQGLFSQRICLVLDRYTPRTEGVAP